MSSGYVAYLSKQEIEDRKRHRKERLSRAKAVVVEHFPESCDDRYVDGWAVMAVMELWHRHGEGKVTMRQVRALRSKYLARLAARQEATA